MSDPDDFPVPELEELPAADLSDPVIEVYKKDIDRTLLRENLELTVAERLLKFQDFMEFVEGMQAARLRGDGEASLDVDR